MAGFCKLHSLFCFTEGFGQCLKLFLICLSLRHSRLFFITFCFSYFFQHVFYVNGPVRFPCGTTRSRVRPKVLCSFLNNFFTTKPLEETVDGYFVTVPMAYGGEDRLYFFRVGIIPLLHAKTNKDFS